MKLLIALLAAASIAAPAFAKTHRDPGQVRAFKHSHTCPSTGRNGGKCPGYIVDHRVALCRGGADSPSNMQWQTKADAKAKDRWECK